MALYNKPIDTSRAPPKLSSDNIERDESIQKSVIGGLEAKNAILSEKNVYPAPEKINEITLRAVSTIEKHMVAQWQCAAWWLERVENARFAKKEGNSALTGAIGIRLCFGEKSRAPESIEIVASKSL
jgi:hypothetical protein